MTSSHTRFEALYGERFDVHRECRAKVARFKVFAFVHLSLPSSWAWASMSTSPEEIEKQLATALECEASGSLNGIADLLALASPTTKPPQLQHKAIYALYRTYTLVFTTKKLDALRTDPSAPTQAVRQWLLQRLDHFLALLTQQLYNPEPSISVRPTTLSPQGSHPILSPPPCKCHFPCCASALLHSLVVMETRKST